MVYLIEVIYEMLIIVCLEFVVLIVKIYIFIFIINKKWKSEVIEFGNKIFWLK